MRRALGTAALATLLLGGLAAPARAQRRDFASGGSSQFGGQILQGHNALATGGLYPSLWFQFTMGMSRRFDLGFRGDLYYASPVQTTYGPGLGFSIPMRLGLLGGQKLSIALRMQPSFIMGEFEDDRFDGAYCHSHGPQGWHCHDNRGDFYDYNDDDSGIGFGFEFGVLFSIPIRMVNVIFGLTSPFTIVFFEDHDGADVFFPVAGFGGVEVRVAERLNILGLVQPGMTYHSNEIGSEMEGFFRLWGGIEYALR